VSRLYRYGEQSVGTEGARNLASVSRRKGHFNDPSFHPAYPLSDMSIKTERRTEPS
jgi:hypothetical protein